MRKASSRQSYAREVKRLRGKYSSTTHYILSGLLLPYSEANLNLAFKPSQFFNDLEKLSDKRYKTSNIKQSYYRAIKRGLVQVDASGRPHLTEEGLRRLKRYEPLKLRGEASVLVIFDIPEQQRHLRDRLRPILRELRFVKVQQSVWRSDYDILEYLKPELRQYQLDEYVQVYEVARIV